MTTENAERVDVLIAGAGAAGLSAAPILGRARRDVVVLDGGPPRNATAEASHGLFTRDDTPPLELLRIAQDQLAPYPSVAVRPDEAVEASAGGAGFRVTLRSGETMEARQLLLATGMVDELPEIPGVLEHWGTGVHRCPYCQGWELRDEHIAILAPGGERFAEVRVTRLRSWTAELTLLTDGPTAMDEAARRRIEALGGRIEERPIRAFEAATDGGYCVRFADGADLPVSGLFVAPTQHQRSGLAEVLDCELSASGPIAASFVVVDPNSGQTSVPGGKDAGDITGPAQSVILAAASGARAAYFMNHSLAAADAAQVLDAAGVPPAPAAQ